ncbi:MAG: TolC family protein [Bacteroidaceae bacterium]|nr:TolC family protein [Bacteroidaceae bacterium]
MSKRFLLMTACAMLLWAYEVRAQECVMSVDELFELCDNNSISMEMARATLEQATEGIEVARSAKLPDVEVSLSASFLGNGYVIDRNFGDVMKADMPHFGNNFSLKASQVIYAGGAIDAGIKQAQLQREIAVQGLESTRQNIRFMVLGNYIELYKLRNQAKVYLKNIEQTELLVEHIKARYKEGVALSNDVTRYELQLEQLRLALSEVESAVGIMNYNITSTLDLPSSMVIVPDSALLDMHIPLAGSAGWQLMTGESPRMQIAGLTLKMQQEKERAVKAGRLPQIAIVAENHFDGPITIEVPAIDKNFNYWFVGVGLRYDIASLWKSNRKIRAEKAGTVRAQHNLELAREEMDIAVNSAYIGLQQAFERMRTQEKSVVLATENYNVVNNRYLNGLALVTEMIDASNSRLSAELQLVNARINIIYSYYSLQRAAGAL